jgi:hypothetical protein
MSDKKVGENGQSYLGIEIKLLLPFYFVLYPLSFILVLIAHG